MPTKTARLEILKALLGERLEQIPAVRVVIPLLPPSIWVSYVTRKGSRGKTLTKVAREWKEFAGWEIRRQLGVREPITKPVIVLLVFRMPRRVSDVDNRVKLPLDILTNMKVWKDDILVDLCLQWREIDGSLDHSEVIIYVWPLKEVA